MANPAYIELPAQAMELRDLRSFVAVAEELHFARAAARLHISAPPLTQRIKRLERELGVLLFARTKRSVAITVAGIVLLAEARRMLMHADELPPRLQRAARGETGQLHAGVVGSAIYSLARDLVANMARSIPNVHIAWHVLSSVEQVRAIRENRLDLGLINTPIDHEGVVVHSAQREPLVVVVPAMHRYARHVSIPLRLLKDEVFIMGARHLAPSYYDRVISACNVAGFTPNVEHQAQSITTYIGLVSIGEGISIVPASMAKAGLSGVAYVRIQGRAPSCEISIAWSPNNSSPVLAKALGLLKIRRGSGWRRL